MGLLEKAREEFQNIFAESPAAYGLSPGRVEIIGNHTDYNDGFILSAAIDRHIIVCGKPIKGNRARIYSSTFRAGESLDVAAPAKSKDNFWLNYIAGVVQVLRARGIVIGAFQAVVMGDIPLGAGLSSSAALEMATAFFLKQIFPFEMERTDLARLCQEAENNFVGVNCGILDQFSSAMGKRDHLIFLDCRDLARYEHIPLGGDMALVIANTNVRRALADGTYNRLREDCFYAARELAAALPGKKITHLRDISLAELKAQEQRLPPAVYQRARHVVTENERVLRCAAALREGDRKTLGEMMLASHGSSRDDFGNSCAELDAMVECGRGLVGCLGCRLSGGGFGGCTVNLVARAQAEQFACALADAYRHRTGIAADIYLCKAVDGASSAPLSS